MIKKSIRDKEEYKKNWYSIRMIKKSIRMTKKSIRRIAIVKE